MKRKATNKENSIKAKFSLGDLHITRDALDAFNLDVIEEALERHAAGDWGDITESYGHVNDLGLTEGDEDKVISVYNFENNSCMWVITEWNRSHTTVMLADD